MAEKKQKKCEQGQGDPYSAAGRRTSRWCHNAGDKKFIAKARQTELRIGLHGAGAGAGAASQTNPIKSKSLSSHLSES